VTIMRIKIGSVNHIGTSLGQDNVDIVSYSKKGHGICSIILEMWCLILISAFEDSGANEIFVQYFVSRL
jgi:hypothetical protein